MAETGLVIECLEYDSDIYYNIIKHGRLIPVDLTKLKVLDEPEVLENASGLIKILSFSNTYVFNTNHLNDILRVHTPIEANSYHDKCHNNILTLSFYKIDSTD